MRTYERLNAEVVKFEAQDVITASVVTVPMAPLTPATPYVDPDCICSEEPTSPAHWGLGGVHYAGGPGNICPAKGNHRCDL